MPSTAFGATAARSATSASLRGCGLRGDPQRQRDRGSTTLILAGISTSGVVLSTVRDAADRDYQVLVLTDASADPEPGVHEFLTEKIFPRQAQVITIADLKELLEVPRGRVGRP